MTDRSIVGYRVYVTMPSGVVLEFNSREKSDAEFIFKAFDLMAKDSGITPPSMTENNA